MPRHFKVTVNGREYEVSVLELAPGENAPAPAAAVGVAGMAAPGAAPATVTATPAAPGATGDVVAELAEDDQRLLLALALPRDADAKPRARPVQHLHVALKMKSPVIATRAGQVTRVLVAPRDAVEGGQVLVTIA